ncbi:MAG TPA: SIS domain-containing protein, partial [Fimbriimonadaceae bacterium]|nr:SIS domain-containing protein [Fimbriimonadaceae bacterium]
LASALSAIPVAEIDAVRTTLESAFSEGRTVFVAGNGGSAATASHMACDFQKTTLAKEHHRISRRIRCIALSDNMPLITAWGNDVHYDEIFGQQLRNLANPCDVLLVITASGNSPNILNALQAARDLGVSSIGFLGFEGGKAKAICDQCIVVKSSDYGIIEDAHSVLMHMVTAALRTTVLA